MLSQSVIILIFTLECQSVRRQFNHYQEFLQQQAEEKKALRQFSYNDPKINHFKFWRQQADKGPPRTVNYNPTYGYEPYWMTGDWVFERKKKEDITNSETDCGDPCFKIYQQYGPICGRNKRGEFKNFTSFCAMKTYDCRGQNGWLAMNRGYCKENPPTYPYFSMTHMRWTLVPMYTAMSIIEKFSKKFPGVGEDPKWVK